MTAQELVFLEFAQNSRANFRHAPEVEDSENSGFYA